MSTAACAARAISRPALAVSCSIGVMGLRALGAWISGTFAASGTIRIRRSSSIEIGTTACCGDGPARVVLTWIERGGPRVEPPAHKGFGSLLLEQGAAHEIGGSSSLAFEPEGVTCTISLDHSRGGKEVAVGPRVTVAPWARFRSWMAALVVDGTGSIGATRPAGQGGRARARSAKRARLSLKG